MARHPDASLIAVATYVIECSAIRRKDVKRRGHVARLSRRSAEDPARAHDRRVREECYVNARARRGRGEPLGEVNAPHGGETGVAFTPLFPT
jgi:hypothetical protein